MSKDLGTGSTSELLKWATPVENRSVNKPASSDTPYQANMAFVMNKNVNQDKWYKGDSPTSYEIYGRIGNIYQTDPARASQLYSDFNTLQNTPGSKYYWPYGNPTNSAVAEMAGYGYDTSKLDDDWFNTNVGLRDYYTFSGSTNTPSKPGAKASQKEKEAYGYYQLGKADPDTKKVDTEWAALQEELYWKVQNPNRNDTDQEIYDSIDWNKYPTLKKLNESVEPGGAIIELNRGTTYSPTAVMGTIWAARNQNPDGTYGSGNDGVNIIYSAMGEGNQYVENPEIRAKLDPNSGNYIPYSLGATAQGLCMYFGVYELTPEWRDANQAEIIASGDETKIKMFNDACDVINYTEKLDKEKAAMDAEIDRLVAKGYAYERIVDRVFDNEEYKDLFALDDTMDPNSGKMAELKQTGWAIDYKKSQIEQQIFEKCYPGAKDAAFSFFLEHFGGAETEQHQKNRQDVAHLTDEHTTDSEKIALQGGLTGSDAMNAIDAMTTGPKWWDKWKDVVHDSAASVMPKLEKTYMEQYEMIADYEKYQPEVEETTKRITEEKATMAELSGRIVGERGDASDIGRATEKIDTVNRVLKGDYALIDLLTYGNSDDMWSDVSYYYHSKRYKGDLPLKSADNTTFEAIAEHLETARENLDAYNELKSSDPEQANIYLEAFLAQVYYASEVAGGGEAPDIDYYGEHLDEARALASAIELNREGDDEDGVRYGVVGQYMIADNALKNDEKRLNELQMAQVIYPDEYEEERRLFDENLEDLMLASQLYEINGEQYDVQKLGYICAVPEVCRTKIPQSYQGYNTYLQMCFDYQDEGYEPGDATKKVMETATRDAAQIPLEVKRMREAHDILVQGGVRFTAEEEQNFNDYCDYMLWEAKQAYYFSLGTKEDFKDVSDQTWEDAKNGKYNTLSQVLAKDWQGGSLQSLGGELEKTLGIGTADTSYDILGDRIDEMVLTLQNITKAEKQQYFYILGTSGEKAATQYMRELMGKYMRVRNSEEFKQRAKNSVTSAFGSIGATAMSIAAEMVSTPIEFFYRKNAEAEGRDIDPYSINYILRDMSEGLREGSLEQLYKKYGNKEIVDFLYNAIYSAGKSAATAYITGLGFKAIGEVAMMFPSVSTLVGNIASGAGKWATVGKIVGSTPIKGGLKILGEFAHAAPMGVDAMEAAYRDAYIRSGGNKEKANKMAQATFWAETLSEAITFSNMHGMFNAGKEGSRAVKDTVINVLKDLGEEAFGESANQLIESECDKWIMGADSNWQANYDYYISQNYDPATAASMADSIMWKEVLESGMSAIASAGMTDVGSYAAGTMVNTAKQEILGNRINSKGGNALVNQLYQIAQNSGDERLIKRADKVNDAVHEKGKAGDLQVGKMTIDLLSSEDENVRKQTQEALGLTDEEAQQTVQEAQAERANEPEEEDEVFENEQQTEQQTETQPETTGMAHDQALTKSREEAQQAQESWRNQRTDDLAKLLEASSDETNSGPGTTDIASVLAGSVMRTNIAPVDALAAAQTMVNGIGGGKAKPVADMVRGLLNNTNTTQETNDVKEAMTWAALTDGQANKTLNMMIERAKNGIKPSREDAQLLMQGARIDQTGPKAETMRQTYAQTVVQSRVDSKVADFINNGGLAEATKAEQKAVDDANQTVKNTKNELARANREAEAAAKNLQAASAEYDPSPKRKETAAALEQAANRVAGTVNQKTQAETALKNAQEKAEEAGKKLSDKTDEVLNGFRTEAQAAVQQELTAEQQAKAEQDEAAQFEQALVDNGIITPTVEFDPNDMWASNEDMEARRRAHFNYHDGKLTYHGPQNETMIQALEEAGFHKETAYNPDAGEGDDFYVANRNDVNFADVKRLNDMVNNQIDEQTGKAQEDRENAAIDQLVASEDKQGFEAEQRADELKEQRDKVKIKLRNLTKPVTDAEGYLVLKDFERKLGMRIELEDLGPITKEGWTRGKYKDGVITLNKNMTIGQAILEALLHEVTHGIRNTSAYQTYRNVVLESVFNGTGDTSSLYENNADYRAKVDATINERIKAGDPNFVGKTHDQQIAAAEDEIVADFARLNLAEKDVVQRFVDAGLGGKIRNALHNINQMLKNYLPGMSKEERQRAEYFRKAERAFQKAMDEASRKAEHPEGGQMSIMQIAQSTGLTFNEDTLQLYDKDGNEIDGVKRKITPDMIEKTPVGLLINNGLKGEQNTKAKEMMAGLMNLVARYKDSDLVWEIGATTLNSTFSALKSNSDPQYKTTVDFGTVCAKTQAIIDTLSQVMLDRVKEGKYGGLTRKDIMKVYDAVNKAGLSVPCPVCYVFSRWMGVPSLLGQMSQYQHDYVVTNKDGSINREATQENVNKYIQNAESEYGDAKAINNQKTKLQNKQAKLEEKRIELEAAKRGKGLTAEQKADIQKQLDSVLDEQVTVDKQLGEVNAYNWITQALCKKDSNGNYVVDEKFKLTPDEILFDLNRTGEFAGYEKNWRYRNTRGAGMGKAIMPYSGETIGDILFGVKKVGRQSNIKNPWLNMDDKAAAKQLREAQNRAIKQNLVGGQRLQSTSDFRPEWGLDYIMSFLELQAAGSKVQMYTKVAEAVDFFASVGADVNLSIMGKGQGWHVDENGKYVLDFSSVTGMDYETAKALKNKYNNVQMILVGMNDTHIRLAMADSDIDFIIPWHSSGNSKDVISGLMSTFKESLENGHNYEDSQNDTVSENRTAEQQALWDARMKLLTKGGNSLTEQEIKTLLGNPITADLYKRFTQKGVDNDCYGVKLSKEQANQIFPYEYWNTSLTKDQADENGRRFVEYCEAMGLVPRFSQFKDDPGYWKLLIDRPMYNNDGSYHQQQVIDVTNARIGDLNESGQLENSDLPTSAQAKYAPKDPRNANYAKYTAAQQQAIENAEAMINNRYDDGSEGSYSVYGEMSEADREMIQQMDKEYSSVVKMGRYDLAEKMVDEAAKEAGYTIKAYHGTPNGKFNVFEKSKVGTSTDFGKLGRGFYFTSKQRVADYYAGYLNSSTVMPVYLKLENPLVLGRNYDNMSVKEFYDSILGEGGPVDEQRSEELTRWLIDHEYDGIIAGDEYMVLDSANIKSAESATYDKYGDLIPLSERFNDQNPDIRYSANGEMTEADLELMAQKEMNDTLVKAGVLTQEEADAYFEALTTPSETPDVPANPVLKMRQFAERMQDKDFVRQEVKDELRKNGLYKADTNEAQVERAADWLIKNSSGIDPTGLWGSIDQIRKRSFNSQSPDGQARLFAAAALASRTNDVNAQAELMKKISSTGTTAGQTLQARKLWKLMTPDGRAYTLQKEVDNLNQKFKEKGKDITLTLDKFIEMAARAAQTKDDFDKVRDAFWEDVNNQIPASWAEKLEAWRMFSMLAAPTTHLRNIGGNMMAMPLVSSKNKVGAVGEILAQKAGWIDKSDRTKTLKPFSDPQARRFARQYAKQIQDRLTGEAKYKEGSFQKRNRKAFGRGDSIISKTVGKGLQTAMDFVGNALEFEDWVFLKGHFRRALGGYMTAQGLKPSDMTGETLEKATEYAVNEAQKATYRDASAVADLLSNLNRLNRSDNSKVDAGLRALQFIVNARFPFKKTPINIAKRGLEYSPVGLGRSVYDIRNLRKYNKAIKNNSDVIPDSAISPTQYIDRLAAGLTGSAVTLLGFLAGAFGVARLKFDPDDPEDRLAQLNGEQEYSVNLGKSANGLITKAGQIFDENFECELFGENVSTTMDWAVPVVMPFFSGVSIYNAIEDFDTDGSVFAAVLKGITDISEPMVNTSMLQSVNDMFKTNQYSSTDPIWQFVAGTFINYGTSLIPTFFSKIANTIDPEKKNTYVESGTMFPEFAKALEQIENKLPFLKSGNTPYYNAFGETSQYHWAESWLSPAYFNETKDGELVYDELKRLLKATENSDKVDRNKIVIDNPDKSFKVGQETVRLNDKQYAQLKHKRGTMAASLLEDLMSRDEYVVADDDTKAMMVIDTIYYSTKVAKHDVDGRVSLNDNQHSWIENAYNNGNPVDAIIDETIEKNRIAYINGYSEALAKAAHKGLTEEVNTCLQMLEDAGATEREIRDKVSDYYRPLYYEAYMNDDDIAMDDIKDILYDLDIGYKKQTFSSWDTQAKKKMNQSDDEEESTRDERWLNTDDEEEEE